MPKIYQKLIFQSRDRNFLLRSSIIIGIISILIGIAVPQISLKQNQTVKQLEILCPWIKTESISTLMGRLSLQKIKRIINHGNEKGFNETSVTMMAREGLYSTALMLGIPQNSVKQETQKLIENYVSIMSNPEKKNSELFLKLMVNAESTNPKRFTAEFYADVLFSRGKTKESLHFYEKENKNFYFCTASAG